MDSTSMQEADMFTFTNFTRENEKTIFMHQRLLMQHLNFEIYSLNDGSILKHTIFTVSWCLQLNLRRTQ